MRNVKLFAAAALVLVGSCIAVDKQPDGIASRIAVTDVRNSSTMTIRVVRDRKTGREFIVACYSGCGVAEIRPQTEQVTQE